MSETCYRIGRGDEVPRFTLGSQGDDYWAQYGGVPVGPQFCREGGGDSLDPAPEPEPPGTPIEHAVSFVASGVRELLAPVVAVFRNTFAPPAVRGERSHAAALASVAPPVTDQGAKPCACHGKGHGPAPGHILLGVLLVGWLAWKAFKK